MSGFWGVFVSFGLMTLEPSVFFLALFCSDGERAENSTKQAELLGGYTAYRDAIVPIVVTLGIHRRTRYVHVVHICGTIVRGRPEATMRTYSAGRIATEVTGDRQREHSLEAEWAGAGGDGG